MSTKLYRNPASRQPPGMKGTSEDQGTRKSSLTAEDTLSSAESEDHSYPRTSTFQSQALGRIDSHGSVNDTFRTGASLGSPQTSFLTDLPIEDVPPPAYSDIYGRVDLVNNGLNTVASVSNDGRVDIHINQKSRRLSDLLAPALKPQTRQSQIDPVLDQPPSDASLAISGVSAGKGPPPLSIVVHVVGSRGDVQPFIALGKVLKDTYGHRVRLATHSTFRAFVEENGLEFFSIGGDPAELMAFMVRNPGLMPGKDALRSGEISRRRKGMYEIMQGCWRSCFEAGDGTGPAVTDDNVASDIGFDRGSSLTGESLLRPFIADVVIANPPSFAHIHCAEKLGIPLHLMFTMPWSPTQSFPHPLANIQASNADPSMTNFLSYALVEMMTWQGLGDVVNRFREKSLGLEPVNLLWAPGIASRLRIPFTYCWSPALIPKPKDWGRHISVSGFYFLDLAENYAPPPDLAAFLDAGAPPIYIGFGSIVVDDPNAMTELIFETVRLTGRRALVSKGWGGFGAGDLSVPEGVFMLGNVPHDWLFRRVCCVVHHGGAGTTAAGVALGKPTVIVPFFGDQPFWGAMIAKAGAGPFPIPIKQLTSAKLANGISQALTPEALQRAQELGAKIAREKGSQEGAESLHRTLGIDDLRCNLASNRSAVWRVRRTKVRLSAFAATALVNEGLLESSDLKLYRPREYETEDGPWDPITGGASALLGTIGSLMMGVADFPLELFRGLHNEAASKDMKKGNHQEADSLIGSADVLPGLVTEPSLPPVLQNPANSNDTSLSSRCLGSSSHPAAEAPTEHRQRVPLSQVALDRAVNSSPSAKDSVTFPRHMSFETALSTGKGVGRIVGAGLKSPMDFTLGLARGFHNAPRLYGDESVRPADKITGISSGLKAASKGFGFGFYDGISGLVTQPLEGAKKDGVSGLLKGFGKGIGGVVLKPGAAIWGIPGYTFKGIYRELQKRLGTNVQNYILAARTAQGFKDWQVSSEKERQEVISRWYTIQAAVARHRKMPSNGTHAIQQRAPSELPLRGTLEQSRQDSMSEGRLTNRARLPEDAASSTRNKAPPQNQVLEESDQYYSPSSNAEEEELIERAVRASLGHANMVPEQDDDEDGLREAVQASIAEANHAEHYEYIYHQQVEEALRQSLHPAS